MKTLDARLPMPGSTDYDRLLSNRLYEIFAYLANPANIDLSSPPPIGDVTPNDATFVHGTFTEQACFENVATPATPASGTVCLFGQNAASGVTRLNMLTSTGAVLALFRDAVLTVRNSTGSTITKGSAVYINGSNGTVPTIALAQANAAATARQIGVAIANISNNAFGTVQTQGEFTGLNTTTFSQGDTLWLSATTPGALQNTEPASPNMAMRMATVITSSANGKVQLFVQPAVINWGSPPAIGAGTPNTGAFTNLTADSLTVGGVSVSGGVPGFIIQSYGVI